jgi:hypothetical protein
VAIVLLASHQRPGEYLLLDAETRELLFGPFHSHENPLLVEVRIRRELKGRHTLQFEWAPQLEDEAAATRPSGNKPEL